MLALCCRFALVASFALSTAAPVNAQYVGKSPAQLGKVEFATSCTSSVQDEFVRGVALLHSFW